MPVEGSFYRTVPIVGTISSACVIGLAVAVWTMAARLLPAPAGSYAVSVDDRALPSAAAPCPLSTRVWYPISDRAQVRQVRYDPAAKLISARRWATMSVAEGVPPTSDAPRLPVIIFLPGWTGGVNENTSLVRDLASRGFVVVAVGYDDGTCSGLAPTDKPPLDLSTEVRFQRTQAIARTRFERIPPGVSRLFDGLIALDRSTSSSPFAGRLDLSRLAVVGHSFGGALAIEICSRDSRASAAVDIDGWLFGAGKSAGISQPWLILDSSPTPPNAGDLESSEPARRHAAMLDAMDQQQISAAVASGRATLLPMNGTEHTFFADFPYLSWWNLFRLSTPGNRAIPRAAEAITAFLRKVWDGPIQSDAPLPRAALSSRPSPL